MDNAIELTRTEQVTDALSETLRVGAQQLIEQAVEAELQEYRSAHGDRPLRPRSARSTARPALARARDTHRDPWEWVAAPLFEVRFETAPGSKRKLILRTSRWSSTMSPG